jgi:protein-tyrosine phosphatase
VTDRPTFTVLLVCTGNICRSALAERLGHAYLDEALGPAAGRIRLESAGTRAVVGSGMHPDSALVLRGLGGSETPFEARQLREEHAAQADLVLAMTRDHRRDVLARDPRALARTFTLLEAAALLDLVDPGVPEGADFPARARSLVRAMAAARSLRAHLGQDDVPDPINRPIEAHEAAGELIAGALLPVLQRLVDLVDVEGGGRPCGVRRSGPLPHGQGSRGPTPPGSADGPG